jgi:hypothetical protein
MLQTIYISVKTKSHFNIKNHSVQSWSWAKDSIGFHFLTSLQLIFSSLLCDLNPMINWTWKLNVHCLYLLLYNMKAYSWHMLYIKGRLVVDTSYHIKWSSQLIHFIIYITVYFLSLYFSNFLKSMNIHTGVIIVFWSCQLQFRPSFRLIIVLLTRVPRWVTLVEQELLSLPVHLSHAQC